MKKHTAVVVFRPSREAPSDLCCLAWTWCLGVSGKVPDGIKVKLRDRVCPRATTVMNRDGCGLQSLGNQAELCLQPWLQGTGRLWLGPTFVGWSPLQKVRVIQEQNLECQCPARLVAVNGCCPYLELSTVTSLPLSGDRELGESVICKAFYCLALNACFIALNWVYFLLLIVRKPQI